MGFVLLNLLLLLLLLLLVTNASDVAISSSNRPKVSKHSLAVFGNGKVLVHIKRSWNWHPPLP